MCHLTRSAEFLRFQNWINNTAQEIMLMKKAERTNNCNDLGNKSLFRIKIKTKTNFDSKKEQKV